MAAPPPQQQQNSSEKEEERRVVHGIIDFLNEASTPFHAVQAASERLRAGGFQQILVRERVES